MIKLEKFVLSKRPYAVDLSSLRVKEMPRTEHSTREHELHSVGLTAVWFRGPKTAPKACIGRLWDYMLGDAPTTAVEALQRMDDGRYGGDCQGRWNGEGYWGAEYPELAAEHMAILRPMLENFPAAPDGFDGWWTYP